MSRRVIVTALGCFTAAVEQNMVVGLQSGATHDDCQEEPSDSGLLDRLEAELAEYAQGQRRTFDLPLRLAGTDFQTQVWEALRRIPYGETRTYSEIAAAIGRPKACRAVGAACGKNPILLLVPCHRVVGKDGSLTGFSAEGGTEMKKRLLELEQLADQSE